MTILNIEQMESEFFELQDRLAGNTQVEQPVVIAPEELEPEDKD